MQIYQRLTPIHAPQGSAVALGYFDGVHCGHRAVLGAAVECARAGGLTAAAFTFELPASSTLKGGRILSLPQKHARVASLGIEEYQEAPFDEFRALTPEDFVQKVLVGCFNAKQLFCGDNFTQAFLLPPLPNLPTAKLASFRLRPLPLTAIRNNSKKHLPRVSTMVSPSTKSKPCSNRCTPIPDFRAVSRHSAST